MGGRKGAQRKYRTQFNINNIYLIHNNLNNACLILILIITAFLVPLYIKCKMGTVRDRFGSMGRFNSLITC